MKTILLINIGFVVYSFALYMITIHKAVKIEYNLRQEMLLAELFDDKILFRRAMRAKLWLLLTLSGLLLMWFAARYELCSSMTASILALFFSVTWFLLALLMYLIYSKKDFTIFKLTKQEPNTKAHT